MLYVKHNGRYRLAEDEVVYEAYARLIATKFQRGRQLASPCDTEDFLIAQLQHKEEEHFGMVSLDNRHRILSYDVLFHGTIDNTTVYPRVLVRHALKINAAAVILAHNHPSGEAEPSDADRTITRRIRDALELVDIRLLDHLVVGSGRCISLAARGLL